MEVAELTLEFVRVVLSAPPVIAVTASLLIWFFRKDIRALLERVATIKFPGGEVSTSQTARGEPASDETSLPETAAQEAAELPADLTLGPEDQKRLTELFHAERARAAMWEYRYLGYYLAPGTQRVLDWLAGLPQRTTVSTFDALWSAIIPSAQERKAILGALERHHLIELSGELIDVTDKGREYLQWRGPLPALPQPNPTARAD